MYSKKKYLLFCTIIYSVFLLLLVGVEAGVRAALPYVPAIEYFVPGYINSTEASGDKLFEGDPLLGWRLMPHRENVYWDFTMVAHTNNLHLRMPYDIGARAGNTIRMLCLGDSVTFGYRVPLCFRKNPGAYDRGALPYPRLVEQALQERYPHKKIEVLSMAVPGYTTYQGLNWLKRDIDRFDPDLITICYGWNDSDYRPIPDRQALPDHPAEVLIRGLVARSQAAIYFARAAGALKRKMQAGVSSGTKVNRVSSDDYIGNILQMVALARARGAEAIVLGQVYRDAAANPEQAEVITANRARLEQRCRQAGIAYLQFDQLTESGFPGNKRFFGELIHPNTLGHRLMAEELISFMDTIRIMDRIGTSERAPE